MEERKKGRMEERKKGKGGKKTKSLASQEMAIFFSFLFISCIELSAKKSRRKTDFIYSY